MKKIIALFILVLSNATIYAQDSYPLNNTIEEKQSMRPGIRYEPFGKEHLMRIEINKVTLYDSEYQQVWEKQLSDIEGAHMNGPDLAIVSDADAVYFLRYGLTVSNPMLVKVSLNGEIKEIDFTEFAQLRGVMGIQLDEEVLMIAVTSTQGVNSPVSKAKLSSEVLFFDKDLNKLGKNVYLPGTPIDSKYNYYWVYKGVQDEGYCFQTRYYLEKKGEETDKKMEGQDITIKSIIVDADESKIISDKNSTSPYDHKLSNKMFNLPIKYDQAKYSIKAHNWKIENNRGFSFMNPLTDLKISFNGNSTDIIKEFWKLVNPKKTKNLSLRYVDAVTDPINNSIVLVVSDYYRYFFITFDENLKISKVDKLVVSALVDNKRTGQKIFSYPFTRYEESYGEYHDGHKMSAFELALKQPEQSVITIINYENSQLLICDDMVKKTTIIHEFTK